MRLFARVSLALLILSACTLTGPLLKSSEGSFRAAQEPRAAASLPDLSGLAWVEGDTFLAVHDAKNPEENASPRLSLLRLPRSLEGITWLPVQVDWPQPLGLSSDLESLARIPGTQSYLLIESGEGLHQNRRYRRVFLLDVAGGRAVVRSFTELPESVNNIEGAAVARFRDTLVFLYSERAEALRSTDIFYSRLNLEPLGLGPVGKASFRPQDFTGPGIRLVSAIEIDGRGNIYVASALDPGNDNGPFTSVIRRIGRVTLDLWGRVRLTLSPRPGRLATLDGFKVESLALREQTGRPLEIFAGMDDENYGGTMRRVVPAPK
ncbi:MAG TPA: hypothetical protein VE262_23515 [Blastocatellia bacterium]|nr:hypothetical protein [Blastocatellia bacterium]